MKQPATCNACGAEYESTHQCRVERGDLILITYIEKPLPEEAYQVRIGAKYVTDDKS